MVAEAAPPTGLTVSQAGRIVSASWIVPPGFSTDFIEWAPTPGTDSDGFFTDPSAGAMFFDEPTTSWTSTDQFLPGTYYFHVAAYDPVTCAGAAESCVEEVSAPPVLLTVPPDAGRQTDTATSFSALKCSPSQKVDNLTVQASMAEDGTITVGGTVSIPNASRVYKLKSVSARATAGRTVTVKLKLPKRALKAATQALKRHRKVKASFTIAAKDTAGNVKVERRNVKLKR
jgi:hypothetical protein